MSSSTLFRLSSLGGLLSGLTFVIAYLLPYPDYLLAILILLLLSALFILFLLPALYLRQREESGVLGGLGYIVNFFGAALVACNYYTQVVVLSSLSEAVQEEIWAGLFGPAWPASNLIFLLGIILFGIATIKAAMFPRPAPVMYMVGFAFLIAADSLGLGIPGIVLRIAGVVAGAGIVWLSYALWSGTGEMVG